MTDLLWYLMMHLLSGKILISLKMIGKISVLILDASKSIPPNAPKLHGMPVQINALVNENHVHNHVTHCSHTGILIYLNRAPIMWDF